MGKDKGRRWPSTRQEERPEVDFSLIALRKTNPANTLIWDSQSAEL